VTPIDNVQQEALPEHDKDILQSSQETVSRLLNTSDDS